MQNSINDIKSRLVSTFIRLYLIYKTKFLNMFTYFKTRYITNTDAVRGINNLDQQCNLMWRFMLLSVINKAISYLEVIKKFCDLPCKLIETNKNYYDKIETIIHTSSTPETAVTLSNINNNKLLSFEQKTNSRIFLQFTLNNSLCLKNYLIKYRDDQGRYNHTLNNIMLINGHQEPNSDAKLNISFFEKTKKKTYELPYHLIKNRHINYFYNSDFTDITQELVTTTN